LNRDLRVKEHSIGRIEAHRQEVCGLKWSFDDRFLASGGNDNRLKIWDAQQTKSGTPLFKFSSHQAAVKAIAWSPHQANLVVSGGGTADRCIKFWNTQVGTEL
jgi:WD40 repeat protein